MPGSATLRVRELSEGLVGGVMGMRRFGVGVAAAVTVCLAADPGSASAHSLRTTTGTAAPHRLGGSYTMAEVGTLGGTSSTPTALNASGDLVGYSKLASGEDHPFLWHAGHLTDLGTLGGPTAYAQDVNAVGQVVGYSATADGERHAFLWSDGTMTDLGTFGFVASSANAINDNGTIVGSVTGTNGRRQPFRWQAGELTVLPGVTGVDTAATDINDAGLVVGNANTSGAGPVTAHEVLIWDDTAPTVLLSTGGTYSSIGTPRINRNGDVVATVVSSHNPSPIGWIDGSQRRPAVPATAMACTATGINDLQQIVGICDLRNGSGAYLAEGYTSAEDLSSKAALDRDYSVYINNQGQIAGTVEHEDRTRSAVLYTPVHPH
jgi:probable HAF family extracellular repeat protein